MALQCLLALTSGTCVSHIDGLIGEATEEQVTCGMEAKALDRALVAQGDSFVLKIC